MHTTRLSVIVLDMAFVMALVMGLGLGAGAAPDTREEWACQNLTPDRGSLGFRRRTGGDRCEGFFKSNVSGEALSVAFLMSGPLPSSSPPALELSSAGPNRGLNVRAVALPLGTYYRMDASITPDKPFHWPLLEVVQASQLRSADLGIYGWFGSAERPTYVPIRATVAGAPPTADRPAVRLGIRANVALDLVTYNIADDARCHFGGKPWKRFASDVPPGAVRTLDLAGDLREVCVSFRGKVPDSENLEPLTARIRLQ